MRRCFSALACLLLNFAATAHAAPVAPPTSAPSPAAHNGSGRVIVPPVPRPVSLPPEYLLTPLVPPGSGPAWRAAQEETLREAMFRYLFKECPPDGPQKPAVYFLSNRGFFPQSTEASENSETSKDPEAAMLNRFRGNRPPVLPVSELTRHKDWRDNRHQNWIIYRVSLFQWTGDATVKIEAGSLQSGFISSNSLFITLALHHGWWEITGITLLSA